MDLPSANRRLAAGNDLSRDEMQSVMRQIMSGEATDAQIGAFLAALMIKGESVEEVTGAAIIMRELSVQVVCRANPVVDCVGTGGDGAKLFNVSTASAIVAACAGANMAKHGNRGATSHSGSADVLEAAGVNIALTPQQVADCVDGCGVGFMFAPNHHSAMRYAIGPRREIGIRSVFNLLGPLTNPARATCQLAGVFSQDWVKLMAEVYGELGSVHTLVVSSDDGLDEISIAAPTQVAEYRDGGVAEYTITPEQYGIDRQALDSLVVSDAAQSLAIIQSVLKGEPGPAADMVALNAGATLYAADISASIAEGVRYARDVLCSGEGEKKLSRLVEVSNSFQGTSIY